MSPTEKRPDWTGQAALAWVIDEAPVPPDLAWTLVVIARRCDKNGRGSYQSIPTLAAKTGKSEKQARRDVARLVELKLIEPGDQTLVGHLPTGRRPVVYDLVMSTTGAKPTRPPRGKPLTPPVDGSTDADGSTDVHGSPTPPVDVPVTPPAHGSQKETLNKTTEKDSSSSGRSKTLDYLCTRLGIDDEDGNWILDKLRSNPQIKNLAAYVRGIEDDRDFWDMLDERKRTVDQNWPTFDDGFVEPKNVPQCSDCEQGRIIVNYDTGKPLAYRCPTCHPERKRTAKPGYDGRRVSTERELIEGWKPQGYQAYRNPPDGAYDDWLAPGPPTPPKDYSGSL